MNIVLSNAARSAACDAVTALADDAGHGTLEIYAGVTLLASFALANPAFAPAVNGVALASSMPAPENAIAGGTADNFKVKGIAGSYPWTGDVGVVGSGAALELDDVMVSIGSEIEIVSWSHTQPAS